MNVRELLLKKVAEQIEGEQNEAIAGAAATAVKAVAKPTIMGAVKWLGADIGFSAGSHVVGKAFDAGRRNAMRNSTAGLLKGASEDIRERLIEKVAEVLTKIANEDKEEGGETLKAIGRVGNFLGDTIKKPINESPVLQAGKRLFGKSPAPKITAKVPVETVDQAAEDYLKRLGH